MNKKDFHQLTILFLALIIGAVLTSYYFAKSNFDGLCSNGYLGSTYSCNFWQSFSPTLWALLLIFFIIYIIVIITISITKALNNYGFQGKPVAGGPFAIFSFFRALYRWGKNEKPTGYPGSKTDI